MQKVKYVLKNGMHKILWDFELHTDYLIPANRLILVIINENTLPPEKNHVFLAVGKAQEYC